MSGEPEFTLLSATPSPFARMNRIALAEKGIPFTLKNEIPWENTTETPTWNPLEKLPILIFNDGREPVYDSAHIQNYIVTKYADKGPKLLTGDVDLDLKARQILTLSEGVLDAFVLYLFEMRRDEAKRSKDWTDRQNRKIDGGIRAFSEMVESKPADSDYILGNVLTIADIAIVCAISQIEFADLRPTLKTDYPELAEYTSNLNSRPKWKETYPVMFDLKASVV